MRIAPLLFIVCVVALSDAAMAQGAATGGTQDTGTGSQLFFPIRPRNELRALTAVPTVPSSQGRFVRGRAHRFPIHIHR
jgi:hypothetical protein